MYWPSTGASVILPDVDNVMSISYWIKRESGSTLDDFVPVDGKWHFLVITDKVYLDAVPVQKSLTVANAIAELRSAINGGNGFYLSDLFYYGQSLDQTTVQKLYEVKTTLNRDYTLKCKEFVEDEERSTIAITRSGIVSANSFETVEGKAVFSSTGKVTMGEIVEN